MSSYSDSDSEDLLNSNDFKAAEQFGEFVEPDRTDRELLGDICGRVDISKPKVLSLFLDEIKHAYPLHPVPKASDKVTALIPPGLSWPTRAGCSTHVANIQIAEEVFARLGPGMEMAHRSVFIKLLSRLYLPRSVSPYNHYILRQWNNDASYSRILLLFILFNDSSDILDSIKAISRLAYPDWNPSLDHIPCDQAPRSVAKMPGSQEEEMKQKLAKAHQKNARLAAELQDMKDRLSGQQNAS
ncbi:hypothetical protein B0I35DRAFT_478248 [Stachybotrys elegans]|uniref:Uncharacterized protein n=1 Tax=Stachybotrys elegans TaxID=80388 RepID=A0A8K0WRA4_9HYPO|nr:hypothetical protein B0I35DRAFT_478248 [Stachybotrys elegans]